ncbi:MAG: hypothetical protein K6G92_08725 [Bacteroidaceae bacterium]|nr:hypothetical protein [Bacteroidaceae bacterium]
MKKLFSFVMLGAIALAGATMFNSCTSEDAVPVNPTFDGESVKTQFTIAFPSNVAETRMTADAVQNAQTVEKFRGMDNIVLIPFSVQGDADADPVASTVLPLGQAITLNNIIKPNTASVTNSIPAATLTTAKGNAVLYNDVTIPVGTGSFLFYGKAIDNGTEKFVNGALKATIDDTQTPANYSFAPVAIYSTSTGTSSIGTALADYVTAIAAATGWASVTAAQNEGLKNLYDNFTSLKAGSSRDVQAAVLDLYQSLYKNTDAISTAIVAAILTKATAPTTPDGTLTFNDALGKVNKTINANSEDNTYPADLGIPDGAAVLAFDAGTFTQKLDGNSSNVAYITGKFTDYVYPASLYYLANSGVVTATTSQATNYNGSKDWSATANTGILEGYTAGKSVKSSTRSVAIVDQIQYAVGRLDTKVTAAAATLYDRKGDKVEGTDASRFPITGVLIGGQKAVNYMFTNPDGDEFTIYDNIHKANDGTFPYATTSGSDYNYTLALETAAETTVNVAVEFLNNSGQDFVGADGLVPEGGKFYLVAQLNPTSDVDGKVSGSANTGKKVFKQDFKTIANFTIGAGKSNTDPTWVDGTTVNDGGLGAAYNTIPDLRTPQLELGLSVNLNWQAGIIFTHQF